MSCAVSPDGKVVLVPRDYPHVVAFNPADKSFEELGYFEGVYIFVSCAVSPDGKVVSVPFNWLLSICAY